MSYKIVRQNLAGQRQTTISNGWMNYKDALERADELEQQMNEDDSCESRGFESQEKFIVVEE